MKRLKLFIGISFFLVGLQANAQVDSMVNIQIPQSTYNNYVRQQAIADAEQNYKLPKGTAWKVGIASAIATPVIGAVPALFYTSNVPTDEQLNFPQSSLLNNEQYRFQYKHKAQTMKRNRILVAYIGGTCISVIGIGALVTIMTMDFNPDLNLH